MKNNKVLDRALDVISETALSFKSHSETPPHVTIFGSARFKEDNEHYKKTVELARLLSEAGYPIMSGAGPGIMEAANKGAIQGGSASLGASIKLPFETKENDYLNHFSDHKYFFIRKYFLMTKAIAIVAAAGGYGTYDELCEYLTLVQTGKVETKIPVVLLGKKFWKPFDDLSRNVLLEEGTISESDLDLYVIIDTAEEAAEFLLGEFKKHGIPPITKES